jgi:hypothetical protein
VKVLARALPATSFTVVVIVAVYWVPELSELFGSRVTVVLVELSEKDSDAATGEFRLLVLANLKLDVVLPVVKVL